MPIYKANGRKDGLQKYNVRINYIANNGQAKQLTRVAYGLSAAKDLEARLIDDIKNTGKMPAKKITVQDLFNEYIASKEYEIRKTTLVRIQQLYDNYILPIFRNYRIDRITVRDIQDWKTGMRKYDLALNTMQTAFSYFSAMINYAIKMEYLQTNPLTKIGNFKDTLNLNPVMNIYTSKEFKKFIKLAKKAAKEKEKTQNDLSGWNYYVFFNIAFYTGLRKGEMHALKWSDIKGSYLTVSRSVKQSLQGEDIETAPKNKSSMRTLQLPLPLIRILSKHKKRQSSLHNFNDDFRICGNIRNTTIQRKNELYSTRAGLKTIRIHDFRHTHASLLANKKINIQEISRRLGHARIEITWNTYCHLYPREEERAIRVLNGFTFENKLLTLARFVHELFIRHEKLAK